MLYANGYGRGGGGVSERGREREEIREGGGARGRRLGREGV